MPGARLNMFSSEGLLSACGSLFKVTAAKSQHQLSANGEYRVWCLISISERQVVAARDGDKIVGET